MKILLLLLYSSYYYFLNDPAFIESFAFVGFAIYSCQISLFKLFSRIVFKIAFLIDKFFALFKSILYLSMLESDGLQDNEVCPI